MWASICHIMNNKDVYDAKATFYHLEKNAGSKKGELNVCFVAIWCWSLIILSDYIIHHAPNVSSDLHVTVTFIQFLSFFFCKQAILIRCVCEVYIGSTVSV